MKKRLFILSLCIGMLLTGCGKSESSADRSYEGSAMAADTEAYHDDGGYGSSDFSSGYSADYAAEEPMEYEEAAKANDVGDAGNAKQAAPDGVTTEEVEEYGSRIIRSADISLDVKSLEEFADNLRKEVKSYGGYLESMDVNAYDSDYSESRYGYFTVRIPSDKLDDFLNIVKDEGTVTAKSESAEDVTLQYVDVEARISTYEAERDSLMELLDKATTLKDILTLRDEIAEVNYELDSLQRQLKAMQNKISYSTVNINAKENRVVSITGGGRKSFLDKISENFMDELEDGLDMAIDLLIFVITRLPLFLILALIVFIIVKIIKAIVKPKAPKAPRQNKKNKAVNPVPPSPVSAPAKPQGNMPEGSPQNDMGGASGTHFTSNAPVEIKDGDNAPDPGKTE